jgi:hypothetical protein
MPGRLVYKLGEHRLKVLVINPEEGSRRRMYKSIPILSRCLERTGRLLGLDRATEDDIKVVKQIKVGGEASEEEGGQPPPEEGEEGGETETREIIYYRLGSWRADRIILVYKKYIEESGGEEGGQQQGGEGEGAERERRYKLKRLYIPIPSWAQNYVVLPTLFSKAEAAGLELVGAYRHGYMIPAPGQLGKGQNLQPLPLGIPSGCSSAARELLRIP